MQFQAMNLKQGENQLDLSENIALFGIIFNSYLLRICKVLDEHSRVLDILLLQDIGAFLLKSSWKKYLWININSRCPRAQLILVVFTKNNFIS